jgi:phosphoribosylamine---glycine ligase
MRILVVGGGGREHALCWAISASPLCTKLFCAPGNAGIAEVAECVEVGAEDISGQVALAQREKIDFVVIGPDAPLVAGMADAFTAAGIKVFGPSKQAAQLEGSKGFTKELCRRHGIPTAAYERFTDTAKAEAYIRKQGAPIVVKADGLAAGKGVIVAETVEQAIAAARDMLEGNRFGASGASIVVEEFMDGEEVSLFALSDGEHVLPLVGAQDHKRAFDGDKGPNTGGMGAYSPAPIVSPALHNRIMREIIQPAIHGMARDGIPYTGFLYAGLMIGDGPDATRSLKVLEFNCRMGDPETQPIMLRMKSDFSETLEHAVHGTLDQAEIVWDRRAAVGVVLAAAGYPDAPRKGDAITALAPDTDSCMTFHAGSTVHDGKLVTDGGRVLCVTALGDSIRRAQQAAYDAVNLTLFEGRQYRRDIGWRALTDHSRHD